MMNGLFKLPIEKYKIIRRNLKQSKEPAAYLMSPESGRQDTARGAIRSATADRNGGAQTARIQHLASRRITPLGHGLRLWGLAAVTGVVLLATGATWTARAAAQVSAPVAHVLHAGSLIRSLAFSGDGRLLVSGGSSTPQTKEQLKLWDARAGRLLKVFPEPAPIAGVGMSRDGRLVASVGFGSVVKLWDTGTGRMIRSMALQKGSSVCCVVAISPDGRFLASTDWGRSPTVLVWDARTGALERKLGGASYYVQVLGFSPDGRTLTVSAVDENHNPILDLWDVRTGRLVKRLDTGFDTMSFAYSPDGTTIATVAAARKFSTLILLDVRTGQELASPLTTRPPGPGGGPHFVAYSPSGRYLAMTWSLTDQGPVVIRLWDLRRQTTALTLRADGDSPIFSPDGTLLAAGIGLDVVLWDVRKILKP